METIPHLVVYIVVIVPSRDRFYHCSQLKSSPPPNIRKKPRIVRKMTQLPAITRPQAPHRIILFRASTIGNPKADTTMPVVKKYARSLHALVDSVSSTCLLAIKFGIGDRM